MQQFLSDAPHECGSHFIQEIEMAHKMKYRTEQNLSAIQYIFYCETDEKIGKMEVSCIKEKTFDVTILTPYDFCIPFCNKQKSLISIQNRCAFL